MLVEANLVTDHDSDQVVPLPEPMLGDETKTRQAPSSLDSHSFNTAHLVNVTRSRVDENVYRPSPKSFDSKKVRLSGWKKALDLLNEPCLKESQVKSLKASLLHSEEALVSEVYSYIDSEKSELSKLITRNAKFASSLSSKTEKVIVELKDMLRLSNDFVQSLFSQYQGLSVEIHQSSVLESQAMAQKSDDQFNFLFMLAGSYAIVCFCLVLFNSCVLNHQLKRLHSVKEEKRNRHLLQSLEERDDRQQNRYVSQTIGSGGVEMSRL